MSVLGKTWKIQNADPKKTLLEKIFQNRGLKTQEEIENFLKIESLEDLHDPFLMKNMKKAVSRIKRAMGRKERIIVFGDYDADGITGTAILIWTLKDLGAQVSYRLPHRVFDGYGLNSRFIKEFGRVGAALIITVDCGIANAPEIILAKKQGIDVIVTDHHTIPEQFPDQAYAVLHPKQPDCGYPFLELTGAGIAFKLASALIQTFSPKKEQLGKISALIDLASLGTVADSASLSGENRILVKFGLKKLEQTNWPGLHHLKEKAGVSKINFDSEVISFCLAPRLNASGRMDSPYWALQLLLQKKGQKSVLLAEKLEKLNQERQKVTEKILKEAEEVLKKDLPPKKILIAYQKNWHLGVIGLVAGKLAEKYGRPVILMGEHNGFLVGSARSVETFNITSALKEVREFLDHFGGHAAAAGFSLKKENLASFIKAITKQADQKLDLADLTPKLYIDCEIKPEEINFDLEEMLEKLAPFGPGNKRPVFLLKNILTRDHRALGRDQKHLSFFLRTPRQTFRAIGFFLGEFKDRLAEKSRADVVFQVEKDTWQGEERLELKILDFKPRS